MTDDNQQKKIMSNETTLDSEQQQNSFRLPPYPSNGSYTERIDWLWNYGPWLMVLLFKLTLIGITINIWKAFYWLVNGDD